MKRFALALTALTALTLLAVPAQANPAPQKALKPDCEPDAIMIHPKAQFYFGKKFSALDKNDDGRITENEFVAAGLAADSRKLHERIRDIRVMFAELDKDADGYVFEDGWYEAETCEED